MRDLPATRRSARRTINPHPTPFWVELLESRQLLTAAPTLSVTPKVVTATEGQTTNSVIASFTCTNTTLPASSFYADVDWGNGSHSPPGTIVAVGGGKFNVTAAHRYNAHGQYALEVFIHIKNGFATTAHSTARVSDAALSVLGTKFTLNGGQANPVVVATFTDPFPDSPGATAQIDWGDGSAKSAGTISPITGSPGQFRVGGAHIYLSTAAFPVTVTIANHGQNFSAKSTATVQKVLTDLAVVPGDSVSVDSAKPGDAYIIPISVLNNGQFTLSSISLVDTLPPSLLNVTFKPDSGTYNSTTHIWSGFTLAPGADIGMNVGGTIDPAATADLVNTAVVAPLGGIVDTNLANNTTTRTIKLPATPTTDLTISVGDSAGSGAGAGKSVVPGTQHTYTITVSNDGPADVVGAKVADMLPAGIASDSWTAVATGTSGAKFTDSGTGDINESVDLPSGATITYTVMADIAADATSKLDDTATVTAPNTVIDTDPSNNSSTESLSLTPLADLSVTNMVNNNSPGYGQQVSFTQVVKNDGPSDAVNVRLVNEFFVGGLIYVSSVPSQGTYDSALGVWTIGNMASGVSATLDVVATARGTQTEKATGSTDTTDPTSSNNSASASVTVPIPP